MALPLPIPGLFLGRFRVLQVNVADGHDIGIIGMFAAVARAHPAETDAADLRPVVGRNVGKAGWLQGKYGIAPPAAATTMDFLRKSRRDC